MKAFKLLPWQSLCWAALFSVLGVKGTDWLLSTALQSMPNGVVLLKLLATRPGFTLLYSCAGLAIGALGVFLLGRLEHYRAICSSTLWALVGCLLLTLWVVVGLFDLRSLSLAQMNSLHLMGIIVGVFWSGKRYWR